MPKASEILFILRKPFATSSGLQFVALPATRLVVLFLVLLMATPGFAADRWQSDPPDVLNLKIGTLSPALQMETTSGSNTDLTQVNYLPSTSQKTFVGVGYRNLGLYLSRSNPRTADEIKMYGAGDSTDVLIQTFGRTWTQQYFYQSYSGYYISNTNIVDPSLPANTFIQRPDIQTSHYGVNFLYNFQPGNYSPGAAFNQSGRQLTSGGAWLMMGSLHNHKFSSRPQLLPKTVASAYKELSTLERGDLLQAGVAAGGGYTWAFLDGWYIAGQVLYGFGAVYQNFETLEYRYKKNATSTVQHMMLGFGYNGINNYVAFQILADGTTYPLPFMGLRVSSQQGSFVYGHRFHEISLPWADRWSAWLD